MTSAELLQKLKQNRLQAIEDDRIDDIANNPYYNDDEYDRKMHNREIKMINNATNFGELIDVFAGCAYDAPSIMAAIIEAVVDDPSSPEMDFTAAPMHYDT
ncbi:hypothetical protein LCGC14_2743530 [marine sediment metagenome]|uniref:Uncharacterized protein n=1 Tax=marine sediment metagenome TaxID=412755 RepID=A0A0F9BCR0_9ZZZZ